MREFDIAVRAGYLLPMTAGVRDTTSAGFELRDQLVGIKGSKIAAVEAWSAPGTAWTAKKTIDASHSIVAPGLVNAHSHLPMTLFRGLADDLPFQDWLHKYIMPLEARLVSPELVRLGTELAVLEALMSGTTAIYDMYFYEEDIAEVCERMGIRAFLGENVFDYAAPDNKKQDGNDFRILDRMVERFKRHETITPFIAAHAPYSCSDATLGKVRDYALEHDIRVGIHVSETRGEVETSIKEHGKPPLKRLYDLGVLKAPTVMAHCVHLTDEEMDLAAKAGASAIYNPESNMKLGTGAANVKKLIERGVTVGLGTDGAASNNDLNMFKEMDSAAKLQKLSHEDNTAMTARTALHLATHSGAKALGLGHTCGRIEVGLAADLITIGTRHAHMQPIHDAAAQLVYATTGAEVENVIVHGRLVVENRKCAVVDAEDLFDRVAAFRKRMSF